MNREELIAEAAKAMVAASGDETWENCEQRLYLSDAEAALAVFEKAQAPTNGERGALPIAPREIWDWDTCVVCGSKEVSDRGMVIMGASKGSPYVARIAWCDQSQECREDLRQTSFLLTEFDANMIDQPEGGEGVTHAAQIADRNSELMERLAQAPTDEEREALIESISGGTISVPGGYGNLQRDDAENIVDAILGAGFRRPAQTEPTDVQVVAAYRAHIEARMGRVLSDMEFEATRSGVEITWMRAALRAAFFTGQEDKP